MGGTKTDPGIFINWSLRLGTTASACITFEKFWPISRDLVFDIRALELWVVNEVIMKKSVARRDFYSTVAMWNRLGKNKANVKERDYRVTEHRESCCNNGTNDIRHSTNCSPAEFRETEQRHFEPSQASLTGTHTLDDELLTALRNRLAGVPPMAGALSLKPEPSDERFNMHYQKLNRTPYLVTSEPSKPKKLPTPVATQVDDSMIMELKHQGTSTSHAKVRSTFTQSELDGEFRQRTGDSRPLQQCSIHTKRNGEHQSLSHFEHNPQMPELCHYSSWMNRVDEGFQRASHSQQIMHTYNQEHIPTNVNQMNQQQSFPIKRTPAQDEFPNYPRPNVQPHVAYPNQRRPSGQSQVANPIQRRRSSVQPQVLPHLPEVPHYFPVSGEPSKTEPLMHQTIDRVDPYQQPTVHATNPEHNPEVQTSVFNQQETSDQQSQSQHRALHKELTKLHSSTVKNTVEALLTSPAPRTRTDPVYDRRPSVYSNKDTSSPQVSPQRQHVLAMATQQIRNNQLCKCGSRELNLACFCAQSTVKESEGTRMERNWRDCRCPDRPERDTDDASNKKKKKKAREAKAEEKRRKAEEKRRKAEEKRRKKEEREREKREKKEQRAREKERRKSQNKDKKRKSKSKSKTGKQSNAVMCSCCKCHGRNSTEEITKVASETVISQSTDKSRSKKKSKKDKKQREKKEEKPKEKKKKKTKDEYRQETVVNYNGSCRMSVMQNPRTGEVQGCCNHPESACPALANRESGLKSGTTNSSSVVRVPMASSKDNCGDPLCSYSKRNNRAQITAHRSCTCYEPSTIHDCNCQRDSGRYTRMSSPPAQMDPPPHSYSASGNTSSSPSPAGTFIPMQSPPAHGNSQSSIRSRSGDARVDTTRNRDSTASPAILVPNVGHGDSSEALPFTGRWQSDPRFSSTTADNVLIDISKGGREGSPNKRYVPPCVLYLDCTKVKDLCVIIKDKYEDPS